VPVRDRAPASISWERFPVNPERLKANWSCPLRRATVLDLHPSTLRSRIKKLGISRSAG